MPEILGDAARFFDPLDADGMADVVCDLLGNAAERRVLSEKSLAQSKKYSWRQTANKTADVIKSIAPVRIQQHNMTKWRRVRDPETYIFSESSYPISISFATPVSPSKMIFRSALSTSTFPRRVLISTGDSNLSLCGIFPRGRGTAVTFWQIFLINRVLKESDALWFHGWQSKPQAYSETCIGP